MDQLSEAEQAALDIEIAQDLKDLAKSGLVKMMYNENGEQVYILTEKGEDVAKLLFKY